jgi:hypothetical protein
MSSDPKHIEAARKLFKHVPIGANDHGQPSGQREAARQ